MPGCPVPQVGGSRDDMIAGGGFPVALTLTASDVEGDTAAGISFQIPYSH